MKNNISRIFLFPMLSMVLFFNLNAMPVPETLNIALQKANPGEIMDLGFSKIPQNDILNSKVKLSDSGQQLIYSDDPETVKDFGILYAENLSAGSNRAYIYHVNGLTDQNVKITAVVVNKGETKSKLEFSAKSLANPSKEYIKLGREGVKLFYENKKLPETITLNPGDAVLLDPELDSIEVIHEQLLGAIYDIIADNSNLKIYILSLPAKADTLKSFINEYSNVYATNDGYHREGTFSIDSRISSLPYSYSTSLGIKAFEIASNKKYSQADLPLTGTDNETGDIVELKGNYGVTYSIEINSVNDASAKKLALLLNPRGGSYGGYFQVADSEGNLISAGFAPNPDITVSLNTQAAVMSIFELNEEITFKISFIPAGSTSTPIDILLVPVK